MTKLYTLYVPDPTCYLIGADVGSRTMVQWALKSAKPTECAGNSCKTSTGPTGRDSSLTLQAEVNSPRRKEERVSNARNLDCIEAITINMLKCTVPYS